MSGAALQEAAHRAGECRTSGAKGNRRATPDVIGMPRATLPRHGKA
jgi:hypothetical protein